MYTIQLVSRRTNHLSITTTCSISYDTGALAYKNQSTMSDNLLHLLVAEKSYNIFNFIYNF